MEQRQLPAGLGSPVGRWLAAAAALVASAAVGLVLSAGDADPKPGSLEDLLAHLPAGAPLVLSVSADEPGAGLRPLAVVARALAAGRRGTDLERALARPGGLFPGELRGALAAGATVAAPDAAALARGEVVTAAAVADRARAERALDGDRRLRAVAGAGAARVWEDARGRATALGERVLVRAPGRAAAVAALSRARRGGGVPVERFERRIEGLPRGRLLNGYADARPLVEATVGTGIAWMDAIDQVAVTASPASATGGLTLGAVVRTDRVADADLPLRPGDDAAWFLRQARETTLTVREPARLLGLAGAIARRAGPPAAAARLAADAELVSAVGDLTATVDVAGALSARAEGDPARLRAVLDRLAARPRELSRALGLAHATVKQERDGHVVEGPGLHRLDAAMRSGALALTSVGGTPPGGGLATPPERVLRPLLTRRLGPRIGGAAADAFALPYPSVLVAVDAGRDGLRVTATLAGAEGTGESR